MDGHWDVINLLKGNKMTTIDKFKVIPNSSTPAKNQSQLNVILNGDRLMGFNELDNTPGNLNKAALQLEENITTVHDNLTTLAQEVESTSTMLGDFSDSDEHYIRYKNTWVPVKQDGTSMNLNYGTFSSTRIENNHLIPVKRYIGNIQQVSKSTLSMGSTGIYRIDVSGTIPENPGIEPTEISVNVNGISQDTIKIHKMTDTMSSVNGHAVFPILVLTDVVHISMNNALIIANTQDDVDFKITITKIGDLNRE